MIHGHEQCCGDCLREWGVMVGGKQRWKNWENCTIIINKIYLKICHVLLTFIQQKPKKRPPKLLISYYKDNVIEALTWK